MKENVIRIEHRDRTCGSCTVCCEGWLNGNIYGYEMYPGRPCHFMGDGCCTIYNDRPETPCKKFYCQWLIDTDIPEWLKPDQSKVLINKNEIAGEMCISLYEAGKEMDIKVLNYFFLEFYHGRIRNLRYQIDGVWHHLGTKQFLEFIKIVDQKV